MEKAKSVTSFVAIVSYLAFPVFSGAWFNDRIECAHLWSEAVKQGLSISAYIAIGMFAWRKSRPDVVTDDGKLIGYGSAIFLGLAMSLNVIHKCWQF